jgi:hypothetical protein
MTDNVLDRTSMRTIQTAAIPTPAFILDKTAFMLHNGLAIEPVSFSKIECSELPKSSAAIRCLRDLAGSCARAAVVRVP